MRGGRGFSAVLFFLTMEVIALTIFLSLLLAGVFVMFFWQDRLKQHESSPERDSLMPLSDERSVPASEPEKVSREKQGESR